VNANESLDAVETELKLIGWSPASGSRPALEGRLGRRAVGAETGLAGRVVAHIKY
jgi:hypothetical protein